MREKEVKAQEEQAREARAQEEREEGVSVQEEQVEAHEGHAGEEAMTTQKKCVEEQKETNSMHEENDVSNGHMARWRDAWWVRVDNGPHLRSETEQVAGEEREKWEQGTTGRKESNTLHVVFHFPTASTTNTTTAAGTAAAATAAAVAATRTFQLQ